ncbi:MAG TPA: CAP domain-containing protein [Alphaproteobacteria bacterium]|nr:CAP domain-containing protein [Alphaproteobacteria bacterium]
MLIRTLLVSLVLAAPAIPSPAWAAPADDMLAAVNAARAAQSLKPLTRDGRLDAAACRQAKDLGRHELFDVESLSHRGSDGSDLGQRLREAGYVFRTAAENLAAGIADPAKVVSLWMASDGHRRNILTADFREAGMAQVRSTLTPGGSRGGPQDVWVLVLAAPLGSASGPATAKNPNDCEG